MALGAASSVVFMTLLLSLRQVDGVPWFIIVLLIGFAGLSLWKPSAALMVLAAAIPIASWTGRTWSGAVAWPETLVVSFAAGYSARALSRRATRPDSLSLPIFVFAGLVLASLLVRLLVLYWTIGGAALWQQLMQLATADYFVGAAGFRDVDAAMRLIEGMVLLRAASSVAQISPGFAPRLTRWFVAGAAAAAALNLWRVWQGALRLESPVAAFVSYLTTLRYNVHYGDVNAAGSYFVMALLVAIGLTIATKHARWILAVVLIATSLMLSGSRGAVLAGGLAVIVWAGWRLKGALAKRTRHSWALAGAALLLVGCAVAAVSYVSARRNLTPSVTALNIRAEFARTTLRMIAAYPAFGVGIGQYPERSSTYSSPVLVEAFGMPHENAHNNFFQILGELGILGLAGLLLVLWTAGVQAVRHLSETADQQGVLAGLLAFIVTWLSGHPLLIDEPALLFWLLLGTAVAWAAETQHEHAHLRRSAIVPVAGLILAFSVPVRARAEIASVNLEHRGIGLSGWHDSENGMRYRLAGSASTLFLPSEASLVTVPLRARLPGPELTVALLLNGRPANVVRVPSDRWRVVQIILSPNRDAPRFSRLDLRVEGVPSQEGNLLMIGKIETR